MTQNRSQRSEVSSQKEGRGLALGPLPFALSLVGALLFALCFSASAQQPGKIPRIGYVSGASGDASNPGPSVEAFRQGLRDLGYVEGKTILVEYRYVEGKLDRYPSLVTELVQLKVDVLVVGTLVGIRAAKQATKTIPIVMVINQDPVATGLVDSLARPGENITGISRLTRELSGKRLELLREVVPGIGRVGILWVSSAEGPKISFKEYQAAAHALKIQLQSLEVRGPDPDLNGAFQSAAKERAGALITIGNSLLNRHRKQITDYAIKHLLPAMYESSQWIEPGGLISYSSNDAESYKRAAWIVDKILKATKPADIPVEQPTKLS